MGALKLSERDIERTCSAFLELDGWRCLKTDPVSDRARGKGFGELGMADCLYIRYRPRSVEWHAEQVGTEDSWRPYPPCQSEILWIEWKKPGGKASPHQLQWIAAERARGALVWLAGVDFPATIEGFQEFYRASGLLLRKGL